MSNYQVPEGFLYDKKSGLYYSITEAVDSTGKLSRVLTWFDAESGTYDQEVYPVTEQEGHLPGGVQKAGDFSESPKQPFDKHQLRILILSGSGILLLCAAILFLGLVKSGWLKNRSEEEISQGNVDQATMTESLSETDASEQTSGEAETTEEDMSESVYSEEESREKASYLLSYQEFIYFELGDPKIDSYGVELYDYSFTCNFDEAGNIYNVNIYYLPFNTEKDNFDEALSRSFDYSATTMDKWMEGENIVCIRFAAGGYVIVFKLDYDKEELYSTIELVEDGADPDDPMNLMNITVPDFGTRDDLENAREWLHENGIMGY